MERDKCAKALCGETASFYIHGWAEDGRDEGYVKVPLCTGHKAQLDGLIAASGDDEIDPRALHELTGLEYITEIEAIANVHP